MVSGLQVISDGVEAGVVHPERWMISSRRRGGVEDETQVKTTRGHMTGASQRVIASSSLPSTLLSSGLSLYIL
jgi:hypothetical protein